MVEQAAESAALPPETEPATVALALWATVHGLVSLHLRAGHAAPTPETVFDFALRTAVEGWLAARETVRV